MEIKFEQHVSKLDVFLWVTEKFIFARRRERLD